MLPVKPQNIDGITTGLGNSLPISIWMSNKVFYKILLAQIDKPYTSQFQSRRWPGVSFDMVTRVAGIIDVVEIVQLFWEAALRAEVIQFKILFAGCNNFLE